VVDIDLTHHYIYSHENWKIHSLLRGNINILYIVEWKIMPPKRKAAVDQKMRSAGDKLR
jgi:hypothetical protein